MWHVTVIYFSLEKLCVGMLFHYSSIRRFIIFRLDIFVVDGEKISKEFIRASINIDYYGRFFNIEAKRFEKCAMLLMSG